MNEKLLKYLANNKPSLEDCKEFLKSVQEHEEEFRELTKKLTRSSKDRYYNL